MTTNATTRHPAKGCTKVQRAAFDRICCGDDRGIARVTGAALVKRGVVEEYTEVLPGRFPVWVNELWPKESRAGFLDGGCAQSAPTAPLALVIAALRARKTQEERA
jgi:hypothetical protein